MCLSRDRPGRKAFAVYDFRSKTPPPVYHGRGYQRRLLYLIGGLVLVGYGMWHARDPRNWKWFEALTQPRVAEIDTTAPPPPADPPGQGDEPLIAVERRRADKPDASKPLPERVQAELLKSVVDNVAGLDTKELDAHLHLLEVLREADPAAIRAAAAEPVTHLQLWEQSAAYRGKLVSVGGRVRRVSARSFPANDYGLTSYYEVWMYPDGSTNPVVIRTLELPAEFPQRAKLDEPCTVKGFYYRKWWYMAGDEERPETVKGRLAPMLLARGLDWSPQPTAVDLAVPPTSWEMLGWVAVAAMAVIVVGVLLLRRYTRQPTPDYIRARMKQGDLSNIPDAGNRDIGAELNRLSQADRESDGHP
jgi:hypothetical protein